MMLLTFLPDDKQYFTDFTDFTDFTNFPLRRRRSFMAEPALIGENNMI